MKIFFACRRSKLKSLQSKCRQQFSTGPLERAKGSAAASLLIFAYSSARPWQRGFSPPPGAPNTRARLYPLPASHFVKPGPSRTAAHSRISFNSMQPCRAFPEPSKSASPMLLHQRIFQFQHDARNALCVPHAKINVSDTASLYPRAKARARKVASWRVRQLPTTPYSASVFDFVIIRAAARFLRSVDLALQSSRQLGMCTRISASAWPSGIKSNQASSRCREISPLIQISRPESAPEIRSTTGAGRFPRHKVDHIANQFSAP